MRKVLLVLLSLGFSGVASATLIDVSYTGVVTGVANPSLAGGIMVGDELHVMFRYETDDLVDFSSDASDPDGGYGIPITGLTGATLTNSYNFLSVTLGPYSFNAHDDLSFGENGGRAFQPAYPYVSFLDGQLLGVEFVTNLSDDLRLELLPEETYFGYPPALGGYSFSAGDYVFDGTSNAAEATFTPVPEPSTWALLLMGFGLTVGASRTRRRQASIA